MLLLYLINLGMFGGGPVVVDASLDIAIMTTLLSDPVLASLVGTAIYHDHLPQSHDTRLAPALTFEAESQDFEIDLDGAHPTSEATVIFSAFSDRKLTALEIAKQVKAFWLAFSGPMPPFVVDYCAWEDWSTTYWMPPDGSDTGPYQVDVTFTMGFQDPS
jgi:hypothetical protein